MDIFQSDRFKASLGSVSRTTERLARIMKNDARLRSRDYGRISELNRRLNRVIPFIPGMAGIAGYRFGMASEGGVGFGLPKFDIDGDPGKGFRFPTLPPRPGPRKPDPQPQEQEQTQPQEQTQTQEQEQEQEQKQPAPIPLEVVPFPGPQEQEQEELDPRSVEANRRRQEEAKAAAEAERRRREEQGEPVFEPALISEKLKEIYGEQFPEIFEERPEEIPQIVPIEKPIQQPERELPPPLRLIQGFLDIFKLNELARGTTRLTLGQDGSQEKIREILDTISDDQKAAEKIVQIFGLSTQLIPLVKFAYSTVSTLVPVGPGKYKKLYTAIRFVVNSARQGNLNPARIKQIQADVERYVRTGSFFKGVPDAQRLQSAGMIRAQGARGPAGGYTNPLTGGPASNIFRQTEFARKVQQALGDRFPRIKPPQGMENLFQPGNRIVPFDVRNLGTLVKTKNFNPPKYLEKIQTQGGGFFNRNPIPKKGETQLQPSDIKSQIERSGGFQDSDGNFYIFRGPQSSAPGPQASATTVIQPVIIFRDPPTA